MPSRQEEGEKTPVRDRASVDIAHIYSALLSKYLQLNTKNGASTVPLIPPAQSSSVLQPSPAQSSSSPPSLVTLHLTLHSPSRLPPYPPLSLNQTLHTPSTDPPLSLSHSPHSIPSPLRYPIPSLLIVQDLAHTPFHRAHVRLVEIWLRGASTPTSGLSIHCKQVGCIMTARKAVVIRFVVVLYHKECACGYRSRIRFPKGERGHAADRSKEL